MSMTHEITAQVPRYKRGLRKGRGESSGHGKTSGRGTKGAGARQGGPHWKAGHEGGQTPLHRRLPARGFSNNNFETNWYIVNLSSLEQFQDGATVDASALEKAKLIPDTKLGVKILGDGELTKKLTVLAGWYSKSAHQKITAIGGAAQNLKAEPFQFPKPKKIFVKRDPVAAKKEKAPKVAIEAPAAPETKAETPAEPKPE
jgi:large subunit ribosomal protein L15